VLWCNVGNHRGLNKEAVAQLRGAATAVEHAAFFLADINVIQDALHGFVIDHRAHRLVFRGIADRYLVHAVLQPLQEHVINLFVHDGAGAG